MTSTILNVDQASAQLRDLGYTVKHHGARYLVALGDAAPAPMRESELIGLAISLEGAAPASAPPELPVDSGLPLVELLPALEAHAKSLPTPLPPDHRIPRPAGLPERLSVPVSLVVTGRYQPRKKFDETKIAELADSIREHGILNPLIVFANERAQLELIGGERRLRAAGLAELAMVPVEIRSYTLRQIDEISTIDNLQREDLQPIEEGQAYERMLTTWGISEAELARRLGKNRAYIQQRRAIAMAAPEVLAALEEEVITFSQARAIAQAAPSDPKAQKAAVNKMLELAKRGQRTTEADARAAAEKVVIGKAKSLLGSMGWQIIERTTGVLLWAPSERPRQWTGLEIAEAVKTKRAPSTDAPPAAADKHLTSMLKMRYRVNDMYPPWVGLSTGDDSSELPIFYAAHELTDRLDQIAEEWRAMQARAAAAGWTLTVDASHSYGQANFSFKPAKGSAYSVWGWNEMSKGLEGIEAGRIKPTPAASKSYEPTSYTCEVCKKKTRDYNYVENRRLCDACAKTVKAQIAKREQEIASDVHALMEAWLVSAPENALRLLAAAMSHQPYDAERAKAASAQWRGKVANDLASSILRSVVMSAGNYHAAPVYDSAPALKPQRLILQWTDDEARSYVGQAERAAQLLDADGYATVADVVRTAHRGLAGAPAAAPPPGSSPAAAAEAQPAGPLDELRTALGAVATWLNTDTDATPAAEIEINLIELVAIRTHLDALADAPDVSGADFDALMTWIGELEREIRELEPAEREASV